MLLRILRQRGNASPPSSSSSDETPPGDLEAPEALAEENKQLKRRLQTSAARTAKAVKRASVQVAPEGEEADYAATLQKRFFSRHWHPHRSFSAPASDADQKQQASRERSRCVFSFLARLKSIVADMFSPQRRPQHVFHSCICDDTSTRMRTPGLGRSAVYTVCNTVENTFVRYCDGSWSSLFIPTPLRILNDGKAEAIHRAFTSWLIVGANGSGAMWRKLGLSGPASSSIWRSCAFMGDALKANDAAWRRERSIRSLQISSNAESLVPVGIRLKCGNHQLSLVRRPTVLSVEKFWSTAVRLGHLYETSSFRRKLASALVHHFQQLGSFTRAFVQIESLDAAVFLQVLRASN